MAHSGLLELVALVGATVHGLADGAPPAVCTVLVDGERIAAVGSDLELPSGARAIDASGKHLVPGLIDGLAYHDPLHELLYVSAGVTLIRDHGNDLARVLSAAEPRAREAVLGPWISTAGAVLDGFPPASGAALVLRDAHEARHRTQALIGEGVDFLAVHQNLSAEAFAAVLAEARSAKLQVWGPLPRGVTLEAALAAAAAGDFTGLLYLDALLPEGRTWPEVELAELEPIVERVRTSGIAVVPLLAATARMVADPRATLGGEPPELALVGPEHAGHWRAELERRAGLLADPAWVASGRAVLAKQRELVGRLHAAGVPLVPGSGAPHPWLVPGRGLHAELEQWVAAGIAPADALEAATSGAARALGLDERGVIAPGKVADLVLLGADPRESLAALGSIELVVLRGRALAWSEIDRLLAELEVRLAELSRALARPIEVAEPALPEGALVLRGRAESSSVAGRLAAERFAVVRRPDGALAFAGRRASRTSSGAVEVQVEQVLREGALESFAVTLWVAGHEVFVRGQRLAGQMRVERRADGRHLGTFGVRETLAAVDAGSATAPLLLAQSGAEGPLAVLRFDEGLEPEVVRWDAALNDDGDLVIRTPVGLRVASFAENGGLRVLLDQTASGSITTQIAELETLGGPGLGLPARMLERLRAARAAEAAAELPAGGGD